MTEKMTKMKWMGLLVAMLGALALAPQNAKAVNDGAPADPNRGQGTANLGVHVSVQSGRRVQCDVMQDYYYYTDSDGNEVRVGWASDTYVTNCVDLGDGTGSGDGCVGQDDACLCRKHPEQCGGGGEPPPPPDEPDCVCDAAPATGSGSGSDNMSKVAAKADDACQKQGPNCHTKQTCFNCNKDRNNALSALAGVGQNCQTNYDHIARQNCSGQQWRTGDPRPPVDRMGLNPHWETPRGSPLRRSICEADETIELPGPPEPGHGGHLHPVVCHPSADFEACVSSWMTDVPAGTSTSDSDYLDVWGNQIKNVGGTVGPVGINVSFGGTTTTTEMKEEEGYGSACKHVQKPLADKIVADFQTCADKATKDQGKTCRAW